MYVPVTRKCPVFVHGHLETWKDAACPAQSDSRQIIIHLYRTLHDVTTFCVYQWPEISILRTCEGYAFLEPTYTYCMEYSQKDVRFSVGT